MKSIIFSALVFASFSAFSSNFEAVTTLKAVDTNYHIHFELDDLQKPELEENLPSFVLQEMKARQTNEQEELTCLLNKIRKPEAEEALPAFIM